MRITRATRFNFGEYLKMLRLPSAFVFNHLLSQSDWAMRRLAQHAGKTVRFNIAPFSFVYTIQRDGLLSATEVGVVAENSPSENAANSHADATCTFSPSLLPRLALQDEKALQAISSAGDTALLADIFYLSRHLRWDAAEDMSHVVGDIAAERVVQFVQKKQLQAQETALNMSQALAEYWTEERPLLAKPAQVSRFIQNVDKLRDDLARLEQRVRQLTPSSTQ